MTREIDIPKATSLMILNGEAEGKRYRLAPGLILGRGEVDVSLPDVKVSRQHARVDLLDGAFVIVDLGSHNGVKLNGCRVDRAPIQHGDVLQIGRTELGVVTHDRETGGHGVSSSSLPPDAVRQWETEVPPPIATMDSHAFLSQLGIGLPSASILLEHPEFTRLLDKTRNFAVLYEVSKSLERAQDVETVLRTAVTYLFWVVGADRGYVLLADPTTSAYEPVLAHHRDPERLGADLALSRTIVDLVVRDKTAVVSPNAAADPRFADSPSVEMNHIGSVLCLPLIDGEEVIGVLQLDRMAPGYPFTEDDLELVTVLATFLSLRIRNARLFEEQRRQYDELRTAHDQLKQTQKSLIEAERMAVVGRLSAGMAHEIKNWALPLASADLLLDRFPDDDELADFVSLVAEARDGIASVVDELWRLSKDLPPNLEPREGDLVRTVEMAIRVARCDPDVRIHRTVREIEDVPPVCFDDNHLLRVFINLLRNAGQAMEEPDRIRVSVARDPERSELVAIAIQDYGRGIAPDHLDKIWQPFFTTKGESGMGLGLDMSRRIVQAHGGRIECDSVLGHGTTMRVWLPIGGPPS